MYCKYCGKEIADDSIFCRYCGGKQEESVPSSTSFDVKSEEPKKKEKVIGIPTIKINLSDKQKMWCEIYAVWVLLNFFFFAPLFSIFHTFVVQKCMTFNNETTR